MDDQYALLGLGEAASVVTALELLNFGKSVLVRALYDPTERNPFTILFKNCRDVRLESYQDDSHAEPETALVGILLGEKRWAKRGVITTTAFELSLLYEEMAVERSGTLAAGR